MQHVDAWRCRLHPDTEAKRACERCGGFMCRECSARWVEARCPSCRPKYGPAELTERRLTRIRKLDVLRCDVCGLESPTLLRTPPLSWGRAVLFPPVLLASFVVPFARALVDVEPAPMCPGCERSDELEPCLHDAAFPRGFDELWREQDRVLDRNRRRIATVFVPLLVLAVIALLR